MKLIDLLDVLDPEEYVEIYNIQREKIYCGVISETPMKKADSLVLTNGIKSIAGCITNFVLR